MSAESAEISFHSYDEAIDFPYRAVSRAAVVSVLMIPIGLLGLLQSFVPMLIFSAVGIVCAAIALRAISRWPDEYSGRPLALAAAAINALVLLGGTANHAYVYATEVPDGYRRVSFYEFQQVAPAPDLPTQRAIEVDGQEIFVKGYIHPSSGSGQLRRFILVPDLGTCCFGGQPRSTDMIEVTLTKGQTVRAGLSKLKLAGKFTINPYAQRTADFDNQIFYQLRADQVR
jgi:hypothetical protein